jgi:hypothetical protein
MSHESSLGLSLIAIDPPRQHHRDALARVAGPGWFDSSWDLQRGLEVSERWFGDDGLGGWIEEFLRSQRSIARTASPSSSTAIA